MSVPMFLAERGQLLASDRVRLSGPEARHAATVRRLRPGERVDLTDGCGLLAECVVTRGGRDELDVEVRARWEYSPPAPRLTVVQALAKGERDERAVEAMTEAGVDVIVPWAADRSVARWREREGKALARWRAKAREAAKQSGRAFIPTVTELATTPGVGERLADAALGVVLDGAARSRLTTLTVPDRGDVLAVIGPEGGMTPEELAAFESAGAVGARLGPTVFRTSTAGVTAAAVLLARSGRW